MLDFNDLADLDLRDTTIFITGANSGLGFESAKFFARRGAQVFMAARNRRKNEVARDRILTLHPNAKLELMELDLASFESIDAAVESLKKRSIQLNILLNNAGLMAIPYQTTQQGFEMQMGVNHLGHVRLTLGLLALIVEGGRIVNVSSMAYQQGRLDFDNLLYEQGRYSAFGSYGRSKLANLLFTHSLSAYLTQNGRSIVVTSAHPGIAKTSLFDAHKQPSTFARMLNLFSFMLPSAEMGAKAQIMACLDPMATSGNFYGPVQTKRYAGNKIRLESLNRYASDTALADRFWAWSLTQVEYQR
jgi:NAD(P)-dependent dehydrogenase (short-subunit alcohol dehydrogenase family)